MIDLHRVQLAGLSLSSHTLIVRPSVRPFVRPFIQAPNKNPIPKQENNNVAFFYKNIKVLLI